MSEEMDGVADRKLNGQQVARAGEYLVAAQIHLRGGYAVTSVVGVQVGQVLPPAHVGRLVEYAEHRHGQPAGRGRGGVGLGGLDGGHRQPGHQRPAVPRPSLDSEYRVRHSIQGATCWPQHYGTTK
jgi:hypothetical protein